MFGCVDLIFTNPPFGSKIPIDDPTILEAYELGHVWQYDDEADNWARTKAVQASQPPEILFIERCVRFLKAGTGRCAIVLPDGILGSSRALGMSGSGYCATRGFSRVSTYTPDTFQPHVSVQTSVLVLERKSAEEMAVEAAAGRFNDYEVFMAVADHVGHDKRGNVTYVRDRHGKRNRRGA